MVYNKSNNNINLKFEANQTNILMKKNSSNNRKLIINRYREFGD